MAAGRPTCPPAPPLSGYQHGTLARFLGRHRTVCPSRLGRQTRQARRRAPKRYAEVRPKYQPAATSDLSTAAAVPSCSDTV